MKYPFLVLLSLLILGCSKDDDLESFQAKDPVLSLGDQELEVSNEGGAFEIAMESNLPWRMESDASWIQLGALQGDEGPGAISLTIPRNDLPEDRWGNIRVWITSDYEHIISVYQLAGEVVEGGNDFYVTPNGTGTGARWTDATNLQDAISGSMDGDRIHISQGTYAPSINLPGSDASNAQNYSFFLNKNIALIGGYPIDATEDSESDPSANPTILSGLVEGGSTAHHVVTVSAPKSDDNAVVLDGLIIENGFAQTGKGHVTLNGVDFPWQYGGGIIAANSNLEIRNSIIRENQSNSHAAGLFVFSNTELLMESSVVRNNVGVTNTSNAAGMFVQQASVYIYDSEFIYNDAGGVAGGIQTLVGSTFYMFNSIIANNHSRTNGTGLYHRDSSKGALVNTLVYGNSNDSGHGGGIAMHSNTTLDLINSTVINNSAPNLGGGIYVYPNGNTLNVYNSIVTGNAQGTGTDIGGEASGINSSVVVNSVYDDNGEAISGVEFDLEDLYQNEEDLVFYPLNVNNPANVYGMSADQLINLATSLNLSTEDVELLGVDLAGTSRSGKNTMGAYVPKE